MGNIKTSSPQCPKCKNDLFELRVLRDEGLASAHCVNCSTDYLLLDSMDYWFDVIQQGYPRLTRCSCKNNIFQLKIYYRIRDDGDIDYIKVHSICSACGKSRQQLDFEVDYGGTDHLFKKPLVTCKNPKIIYDLKQLMLNLLLPDIYRILDLLANVGHCSFISKIRVNESWVIKQQDATQVKDMLEKDKFLFIYAIPNKIEIPEGQLNTIKKENAFWKQSEVIRIGFPHYILTGQIGDNLPYVGISSEPPHSARETEIGRELYIHFSNEYVFKEKIIAKTEGFQKVTNNLLTMLSAEFVCWRGRYCFDNPEVHVKVFGDHFQKKTKVIGKH